MVATQTRLKKSLQSEIFRINFDFFRLNKLKKKNAERQTHYAKKLDLRKKVRKKIGLGNKMLVLVKRLKVVDTQ